jgi:hypothetical protein
MAAAKILIFFVIFFFVFVETLRTTSLLYKLPFSSLRSPQG